MSELLDAFDIGWDRLAKAGKLPYDGVTGHLPEWAPEPSVEAFKENRAKVLVVCDIDHARLFLDRYQETYFTKDFTRRTGPRSKGCFPIEIEHHLSILCHLRWCVDQGEEKGIELMAGSDAVRGRKVRQGAKAGHKAVHGDTAIKKEREAAILAVRDQVARDNLRWGVGSVDTKTAEQCGVAAKTVARYRLKRKQEPEPD
jgi:hypothetical protein